MLLPVSLAGVLASIAQIVTGRKAAFARTPKIAGRTAVHPVYVVFNVGMFMLMFGYAADGIRTGDLAGTIIPALNVALYAYGLHRFIGLRDGFMDLLRPAQRGAVAFLRGAAAQLRPGPITAGGFARTAAAALLAFIATLVPASFNASVATDGPVSETVANAKGAAITSFNAKLRLDRVTDAVLEREN
jgi:hypothetical protein